MEIVWKSVVGYEGLYDVSNLGEIRCVWRQSKWGTPITRPKVLTPRLNRPKYPRYKIALYKNGVRADVSLHRLVAEAFIPNDEGKSSVDHIDTNGLNNNVSNLRWVTHKENMNNELTRAKYRGKVLTESHKANISKGVSRYLDRKIDTVETGTDEIKLFKP